MQCPVSHAFAPAGPSDSRSPCPALNALANHGYLPRNGRQITVFQLVRAMHEVYHVTIPLGALLSIIGVRWCGKSWTVALEDFAYHNKIEHSGSLTHHNARCGCVYAPSQPCPELVDQMLATAPDSNYLTQRDLVAYRASLDRALYEPLSTIHKIIAFGELAFTLTLFGDDNGHMPKDLLRQFFCEERIPDTWEGPREPSGLVGISRLNKQIQKQVEKLERKDP